MYACIRPRPDQPLRHSRNQVARPLGAAGSSRCSAATANSVDWVAISWLRRGTYHVQTGAPSSTMNDTRQATKDKDGRRRNPMRLGVAPVSTASPATADSTPLRGRRLVVARAVWLIVAVLTVGLDIAGIPFSYAQASQICTGAACRDRLDLLTPEAARALEAVGLSVGFFAAFQVGVITVTTLVFVAVAALIFWRRSDNWMALFSALALISF